MIFLGVLLVGCFTGCKQADKSPRKLEIFFLGHDSKHHDSEQLAEILSQEYFKEGINITYSPDPDALTREDLKQYDGLVLYANHDSITEAQEKGLLEYVRSGKGFIPIHSASFCFRNSPEVVDLIGGQFKSHESGSFSAEIVKPEHPAMEGVEEFTTEWDETYVHDKISDNIEVLMERVEDGHREPYTWVREYGKGRVFYTAFGHDERTFLNPGFLQLVKRGILWAAGEEAVERMNAYTIAEPEYEEAKMPNYERRDPPPKYQYPLSPKESMTLTQVPPGFRLELFAAEPDINKPIAMNWDERGRLWIVETTDYPNTVRENDEEGDDRISICEDTDGDGRADKFTVFADGLNIPTSFAFVNGGIIVSQAPHFLFLKDTDGDDKADVKEILFSGWGTFDTHAGPSNLKYGMDNRIWGTVGYSGFEGKVGNEQHRFGQGVYALGRDWKKLEFLTATTNNTWGLGFSEEFDVFVSTANNEHSDHFAIPIRYYELADMKERGIRKIDGHYGMHVVTKNLRQVDVHGGFTAAAGHNLYTARSFPEEYWNRVAFICEPTGRVVHKHVLEQEGSGFKEKGDGWNVIASADEWFGPVAAEVGPDGAMWMLDWYNFIIQHNPTPDGFETGEGNAYIDSLRDQTRGRIYRLVHEDAPAYKPPGLSKDRPEDLLKALENPNMFWRTTAQRLLVEAGDKEVADGLYKLIRNERLDEIGTNAPALHALWTLHGLGLLAGPDQEALEVVTGALKHPAAGVRKAAVQVLPKDDKGIKAILDAGVLEDEDLRVRLEAILALAEAPAGTQPGQYLFEAARRPENAADKWISHALLIAGKVHRNGFMQAYERGGAAGTDGLLIERIVAGDRMQVLPLNKWEATRPGDIPPIAHHEISITGEVKQLPETEKRAGVVVAHGDKTNGYALYMKDEKLFFQVNRESRKTTISTPDKLPDEFSFEARVLSGGKLELAINDKTIAQGNSGGLFTRNPPGLLTVGHDRKGDGQTGDYEEDFNMGGYLENARITYLSTEEKAEEHDKVDQTITIKSVVNEMKYDKPELSVKAGTVVKIVFENPDHMQHNLLIIEPGSLEEVGAAADKLAADPQGASMDYIPSMSEILFTTPLVNPGDTYELTFKVPETPGEYPFVCTFPGHWRIMNGIMKVQ